MSQGQLFGQTGNVVLVAASDVTVAVAEAVGRAKGSDPMAPVAVVMPSGVAAGALLNDMAKIGGVFNVRYLTLEHLAQQLTEQQDGPAPLHSAAKRELARLIAKQAHHPLDKFDAALLAKSLVEVFDDLGHRSPVEVERIGEASALAAELVRLYGLYRALIANRYSERNDRLTLAADAVVAGLQHPPVVAVIMEPPGALETDLLNALADAALLHVVAVSSGADQLDATIEPWLWGLGATVRQSQSVPKAAAKIAVVPDADAEVQIAIAELLRHAEAGVAFSRMAILFASRSPYARIVDDQMRLARVPVRGEAALRLSQTLAGGFVERVFDVIDTGFSYEAVSAWLLALNRPAAPEWLRSARRSRVRGDAAGWSARLLLYADELERRNSDAVGMTAAREFAVLLADIEQWLTLQPNTWQGWAEWLQSGLERYLGSHGARESWPFWEKQAAVKVESRIARVATLDEVSGDVTRDVFIEAVREDLQTHQVRSSTRSGVFVGTIGEAIGCQFDAVVMCGLAEGLFPRPPQRDGLLSSLVVPGEELRGDRDTRAFRLRMASNGTHMLTLAMADIRGQRPLRPSLLLLEEAERLAGRSVDGEELGVANPTWPWLEVFSSFTQIVAAPQLQATPQLDDVGALHRHVGNGGDCTDDRLLLNVDTYRQGVAAVRAHDSGELTRHDGWVGQSVPLGGAESAPLRVTQLERWAQCPFRYLLDSVLRVEYDDDDESLLTMTPRDRGELVHSILETFIRRVPDRTAATQPWLPEERAVLHEIVDQHFEVAVKHGLAPDGFTTDVQRKALHRQLEVLLNDDEQMRRDFNVVPAAVESGFGLAGVPAVAVNNHQGEPVWFRGRIDRVDVSTDGSRAVVTDYKTGKASSAPSVKGDPLAGARRLQLGIYAKAVQAAHPQADVRSDYWYVTDERSNYKREGIELDDDTEGRMAEVFGLIGESFGNGAFPAVPGEEDGRASFKNCRHCPYDAVCPRDRAEAWARKSSTDLVQPFVQLSEPQ